MKLPEDFAMWVGYEQVMYTVELLENILSFVDARTLLLSQRVCKYWYQAIAESYTLQCNLFFRRRQLRTWSNFTRNPLLELVFHDLKIDIENQTTSLERKTSNLKSKVLASWHVLAIRWKGYQEHYDRQEDEDLPEIDPWDAPLADGPLSYPKASWRRMLACQPAVGPILAHPSIDVMEQDDPWEPLVQPWPVLTEFAGTGAGPWPFAHFSAMVPFLHAEVMAVNAARMLQGTTGHATAQMRISWGPPTISSPLVDVDSFMFQPSGPTARMMSSGARPKGIFLREGEDIVFSRVEGFGAGRSSHRVLDLESQMMWFVNYWPHEDHLIWRATALGAAKGTSLGRQPAEEVSTYIGGSVGQLVL